MRFARAQAWRLVAVWLLVCAAALLGACGGGGGAPAQEPLPKPNLVGYAYALSGDRVSPSPAASVKGTAGVMRTSNPAVGDAAYEVSVSGLEPPFLLRASGLMTLAFEVGPADTSLLTNLVVEVMAGRTGDAVFDEYGPQSALAARATADGVAAAEAKVRDFLAQDMGITLPQSLGSLLGPVEPQAGNALYDTIKAYSKRRADLGEEAYQALEATLIDDARACIEESLALQGPAGSPSEFCPITKTATRDTQDVSVVTYEFEDRLGVKLTVVVREDQVTRANFAAGSDHWNCEGAACTGIAPQAELGDERRPIVFDSAPLHGLSGNLSLSGTLIGAAPGIVLPPLPCDVNRFHLVLPTREVISDCPDIAPPVNDIGIAGTYGLTQGTTRRLQYPYVNQSGSNGLDPSPDPVTVTVWLEGSNLISITATRYDLDTGLNTLDFKCRGAGCNGVVVGPPTINMDFGIEIQIRDIALTGTKLALVGEDGSLSTDTFASLTGAFRAIDIVSTLDNGMLGSPPDCSLFGAPRSVRFNPGGETVPYDYCPELSFVPPSTVANDFGGFHFMLQTGNSTSDALTVDTDGSGAVVRAVMAAPSYYQSFACNGTCSGIAVSPPDGQGQRTVTFIAAVLRGVEPDGFASSDRVAIGNGSFTAPAPPP